MAGRVRVQGYGAGGKSITNLTNKMSEETKTNIFVVKGHNDDPDRIVSCSFLGFLIVFVLDNAANSDMYFLFTQLCIIHESNMNGIPLNNPIFDFHSIAIYQFFYSPFLIWHT